MAMNRVLLIIATWLIVGIMLVLTGCLDVVDSCLFKPRVEASAFGYGERVSVCAFYVEPRTQPVPPTEADFAEDAEEIDELVTQSQRFFADEMERHWYGKKTFNVLRNANNKVSVTRITLKESADYYSDEGWGAFRTEVRELIDVNPDVFPERRINLFFVNIPGMGQCGLGTGDMDSGNAWVFKTCWKWKTVAHELGHAFGLMHDFRDDSYMMSNGRDRRNSISAGAAGWLQRHSAFNEGNRVIMPHRGGDATLLKKEQVGDTNTWKFTYEVRPRFREDSEKHGGNVFYDYGVLIDKPRSKFPRDKVLNFSSDVTSDIVHEPGLDVLHIATFTAEVSDKTTHVYMILIGEHSTMYFTTTASIRDARK